MQYDFFESNDLDSMKKRHEADKMRELAGSAYHRGKRGKDVYEAYELKLKELFGDDDD
jgi:hypothetical protein